MKVRKIFTGIAILAILIGLGRSIILGDHSKPKDPKDPPQAITQDYE